MYVCSHVLPTLPSPRYCVLVTQNQVLLSRHALYMWLDLGVLLFSWNAIGAAAVWLRTSLSFALLPNRQIYY